MAGKDTGDCSEEELFFQQEIETMEKKTHHPSLKMYKDSFFYFTAINFQSSGVCECKNGEVGVGGGMVGRAELK